MGTGELVLVENRFDISSSISEFGRDDWNTPTKYNEGVMNFRAPLKAQLWLILGQSLRHGSRRCLFFYPINHKHNLTEEKKAAVRNLTAEGFKSRARKEEALRDPNYRFVPFFSSANGCDLTSIHPTVLAESMIALIVRIFSGTA